VGSSCLDSERYIDAELKITYDVVYAKAVNALTGETQSLAMDMYQPAKTDSRSTTPKMPAIVLIHGGNCQGGDKREPKFIAWGKMFAKRGFFAVSINYRLQSTKASCRFVLVCVGVFVFVCTSNRIQ
jgi:carboxylesterase type B